MAILSGGPRIVGSGRPAVTATSNVPVTRAATPAPAAPAVAEPTAVSGTFGRVPTVADDVVLPTQEPGSVPLAGAVTPATATSAFGQLNAKALEAALASIESQFGLDRAELLADRSAIGEEYKLLFAQAQQARELELEAVGQGAQERGIFRSGLTAEAFADTVSAADQRDATLSAGQSSTFENIDSQLAGLPAAEQAQKLEAERVNAQSALTNEVLDALLAAGL